MSKQHNVVPLDDFINDVYWGIRGHFGDDQGIPRQNVKALIDRGAVMLDGVLMVPYKYRPNQAEALRKRRTGKVKVEGVKTTTVNDFVDLKSENKED